jgi:type IV pilus assembly protein PilW
MNPPASTNIFPTGGYDDAATDPAVVINMGAMVRVAYGVSNNSLTYRDLTGVSAGAIDLASGVVALKAQYGIASAVGNQSVSSWISATDCTAPSGTGWSTTRDPINTTLCFPTTANAPLVKAIRVAVVVRSSLLEKDDVTDVCNNNAGVNNGPCAWSDTASNPAPKIDLSADANWKRYRYRVYETIIPLRNVLWANL